MKMNYVHWTRRILASMLTLCFSMTSLGIQPVQAGPRRPAYLVLINFEDLPLKYCKGVEYTFDGEFIITSALTPPSAWKKSARTFETVIGKFTANLGEPLPGSETWSNVYLDKFVYFHIRYTPKEEGSEHLRLTITLKGEPVGKDKWEGYLDFEVKDCSYNIHGSADMGAVIDTLGSNDLWDFVGTYDIVGTIKSNEDGTLSGQGTVSQFVDAFGGQLDDVSCQHATPWQGNTTVEIKADPDAWAKEGVLDLQFNLEPMQVNSTVITCVAPNGGGSMTMPGFTVASFELDPDPVPAEGGAVSLKFHFPNGPVEIPMELIITPEEAES